MAKPKDPGTHVVYVIEVSPRSGTLTLKRHDHVMDTFLFLYRGHSMDHARRKVPRGRHMLERRWFDDEKFVEAWV